MAAKRKSRTTPKKPGTGSVSEVEQPEVSLVDLSGPVELPVSVDLPVPVDLPAAGDEPDPRPVAPKTGPERRGQGRFTGLDRGRGAGPGRQYAFRRS